MVKNAAAAAAAAQEEAVWQTAKAGNKGCCGEAYGGRERTLRKGEEARGVGRIFKVQTAKKYRKTVESINRETVRQTV